MKYSRSRPSSRRGYSTKPVKSQKNDHVQHNTNQRGSVLGNMAGGAVSGFGIGMGLEAARGAANKIFGNSEQNDQPIQQEQQSNNNNCETLSKFLSQCNQSYEPQYCQELMDKFTKNCLQSS